MKETAIYEGLARYISVKYPQLKQFAHFDLSGVNNASVVSRSLYSRLNGKSWPDFQLSYPTFVEATIFTYGNLFIEIKIEGTKLKREKDLTRILKGDYKIRKAGDWWDLHIEDQAEKLSQLSQAGNVAVFGIGLDECCSTLDSYIAGMQYVFEETRSSGE